MTLMRPVLFAAALFSAGHTMAGEPITVEPEGSDGVQSCDKYGEDFVYIADTKTCVKISGEVRATYRSSKVKID